MKLPIDIEPTPTGWYCAGRSFPTFREAFRYAKRICGWRREIPEESREQVLR